MKRTLLFLFSALLISSFSNCDDKKDNTKSITKNIAFKKEGELTIFKATDSILKSIDIEIADNEYETQTGLMYRNTMEDTQGMLFVLAEEKMQSFYMKNTQIPLDIIFINLKKEVVSIQKNTIPFDKTSLPSEAPAKYVLEINAGLSDKWEIEKGDRIEWTNN